MLWNGADLEWTTFATQYVGSFAVEAGDREARISCVQRQLQHFVDASQVRAVRLSISVGGITICSLDNTSSYMAHKQKRISYTTCVPEHCQFAFLAREPHASKQYCHLFQTNTAQQAEDINATVISTFDAANSEQMRQDSQLQEQNRIIDNGDSPAKDRTTTLANNPQQHDALPNSDTQSSLEDTSAASSYFTAESNDSSRNVVPAISHHVSASAGSTHSNRPASLCCSQAGSTAHGSVNNGSPHKLILDRDNLLPVLPESPSGFSNIVNPFESLILLQSETAAAKQQQRLSAARCDGGMLSSFAELNFGKLRPKKRSENHNSNAEKRTRPASCQLFFNRSSFLSSDNNDHHHLKRDHYAKPATATNCSSSKFMSQMSQPNLVTTTTTAKQQSSCPTRPYSVIHEAGCSSFADRSRVLSQQSYVDPIKLPTANNNSGRGLIRRLLSRMKSTSSLIVPSGLSASCSRPNRNCSASTSALVNLTSSTCIAQETVSPSSQQLMLPKSKCVPPDESISTSPLKSSSETGNVRSRNAVEKRSFSEFVPSDTHVVKQISTATVQENLVIPQGGSGSTASKSSSPFDSGFDLSYRSSMTESSCSSEQLSPTISEHRAIADAEWYCGNISRDFVVSILQREPEGSFVVRDSSQTGSLALSVRVPTAHNSSGVSHYLILHTAHGYKLKGFSKEFPSVHSLVTHHSILSEQLPCRLVFTSRSRQMLLSSAIATVTQSHEQCNDVTMKSASNNYTKYSDHRLLQINNANRLNRPGSASVYSQSIYGFHPSFAGDHCDLMNHHHDNAPSYSNNNAQQHLESAAR